MSSGQKPRTPEHFPRMKHRAAGRQERARREILTSFLAMGRAGPGLWESFQVFEDALREFGRLFVERAQAVFDAFIASRAARADYALTPARKDDHA